MTDQSPGLVFSARECWWLIVPGCFGGHNIVEYQRKYSPVDASCALDAFVFHCQTVCIKEGPAALYNVLHPGIDKNEALPPRSTASKTDICIAIHAAVLQASLNRDLEEALSKCEGTHLMQALSPKTHTCTPAS